MVPVQLILQLAKTLLTAYAIEKVIKIIMERTGIDGETIRKILKEHGLI